MKTRIVHTKIWEDEWFNSIPRASRFLFIHLITCPQNNICGIFEISDRVLMFNTGLNQTELDQAKKDLAGRAVFHNGWIKLTKSDKYNNYVSNPKMEIALQKELNLIPDEIKKYMDEYDTSMDTSIYTTNNHKSEIINNKYKRKDITNEVIEEISTKYSIPVSFVESKFDDLCNWEDEKPGRMKGRNWKMTLMNWVKRDSVKIKQEEKSHARRITVIPIR